MSQSYSYGFTIPSTGDRGTALFTLLTNLIKRLIDHRHDGSDSVAISATAIASVTQTIAGAASDWADQGNGRYRLTVTMPASVTFDNFGIELRNSSGVVIMPTIEKVAAAQYYIYANEKLTNIAAIYQV